MTYILSGILLYVIFGATYYVHNNERVKTPLYIIMILCLLYLIPVVNIVSAICWMVFRQLDDSNDMYIDSPLMKKY